MDAAVKTNAQFWDKIARKYAKSPVSDPDAYAHTLTRTRHYLGAEDAVLEVGCGTGSSALKLADACKELLATDVAPEMIAIAREKTGPDNVTFGVNDLQLEGIPDASKDAVLAFSLLHLLKDLPQALQRIHEVVKPGGYFISKTVCLGGAWYLRPVIGLMRAFGKAPFVAFLTPSELDAAIAEAGFEIVESAEHNKGTRGHFVVGRKL